MTRTFRMLSRYIPGVVVAAALAGPVAAQTAEDGQLKMPAKDYASTRYSEPSQINPDNARSLRPIWTFSTGVLAGHEGQPLVVKDTLYVVTPWPNVLYAFDLSKEGYPLRCKYRPAAIVTTVAEAHRIGNRRPT